MLRSQRLRQAARAGQPVIYQYDEIPRPFRVQVLIICDEIGKYIGTIAPITNSNPSPVSAFWNGVTAFYKEELGVEELVLPRNQRSSGGFGGGGFGGRPNSLEQEFKNYFLETDTESVLDMIEEFFASAVLIKTPSGKAYSQEYHIAKLNQRFKEHDLGYQFVGHELIRVDSQFLHSEAVEPALYLLHSAGFNGPEEEFLSAHKHLRHGRHKEAVTDAQKAFESTIKAICATRGWALPSPANASNLINIVFKEGLIPQSLENEFSGLKMVLTGLPTVRNTTSAHGQGAAPVDVPEYVAAYALHMTAANIVFLVEAHNAKE